MSKIRRRSGAAVTEFCQHLGWTPDQIVMAGVGMNHAEVDCFQELWPRVPLIGFEPSKKIFDSIHDNFPGYLHNVGLWDKQEERPFYTKKRHSDAASAWDRDDVNTSVETVKMDRLDAYFHVERHRLLWLDCEGSELKALMGAQQCLAGTEVLNIEMTCNPRIKEWPRPEEIHEVVSNAGFVPMWVHTTRSVIGQFDLIYVKGDLFDPRLCCFPDTLLRMRRD